MWRRLFNYFFTFHWSCTFIMFKCASKMIFGIFQLLFIWRWLRFFPSLLCNLNCNLCMLHESKEIIFCKIIQCKHNHHYYLFSETNSAFCNLQPSTSRFQVDRIQNILIHAFIYFKFLVAFTMRFFGFWLKINVYFFFIAQNGFKNFFHFKCVSLFWLWNIQFPSIIQTRREII